jgi:hypothetical protein
MKTFQRKANSMKLNHSIQLLALLILFALLPGALHAQWNNNTYVNELISTLTVADMQTASTSDGKTWVAFYVQNGSNYDMRAQLIDANGYKLLGTDGILVSNEPSGSATYVFNVCVDASNNLIIGYQDMRTSSEQAVMFKISETGTQLWGATGIVLGLGLSPYPAVLTTGETVIAWNETNSNTLNLQKISTSGTTVWSTPIQILVGTTTTTRGQVIANTAGKFSVVYQKRGVGISTTLYSQMYDNNGNALYSPLQICNQTTSGARYYSIVAEADTTYYGYYSSSGSRFNSFLQRINPGGTIPWGMNGSNFNTSTGSTDNYQMTTAINMTPGSSYVWSVCTFSNTGQTQYGVYIQKFLKTTGARQFTDAAKIVYAISSNSDQICGNLALVNDTPMFSSYDVNYLIYATRLDASGNFVWPGNRVQLSSTTSTLGKMRYGFTPDGPNRCAGTWTENRSSSYLGYAQGISVGGLIGISVATQGNVPATITSNGGTLQLVDTVFPAAANQSATWSIVNGTGMASISAGGLVTAITNGTVYGKAIAVQDNTVKDSLLITISGQLAQAPTVTTLAATGISTTGAMLNGTVNANYLSTTVSFNWGLTTAYGNTVAATPATVSGSTPTPVLTTLSGLSPGTTYHFRATGTNAAGTTNGNDLTFTTNAALPIVVTNAATNIGVSNAQLNGSVNANTLSTTVSFDWGLTVAYGNNVAGTPSPVTGNTPVAVSANITGLTSGLTYHFRCNGTNASGTTNGNDMSFVAGCQLPGAAGSITGPSSVCANAANVGYTIASIPNVTTYSWTVPTGATIVSGQGTQNITVNFASTSGNITVTGSNTCGTGTPSSMAVTVNALPVPTISGNASACQGSTNTYTTQAGQSSYIWSVSSGGQILSGQGTSSVSIKWNNTGSQTVSVNYTNSNGCTAINPTSFAVTVNVTPVPTITGSNSLCVNSGYYTYTTEAGMTAYNWNISPGGVINFGAGTNVITVTWSISGAQWVSVNYTNPSGCQALNPTQMNVTVNAIPGPAGSITGTANVCGGANGVAYSVAAITGATAYVWTLPTGATIASGGNTNSITVNFAANASSGNISVYGNNTCGDGTVSPPFGVTVTPLPDPAGTITGPASVCLGATGMVYTVPPINGASTYAWTLPTGFITTSGSNTNSITVNISNSAVSGNITVSGSNSCGNGTASPNFAVAVNPIPPAPVVTNTGTTLQSNVPAGNQWYFQGNLIVGATGQTYVATQDGYYWDVVTLNGCPSDTSNHLLILTTGINEHSSVAINIYPVPNDGQFNVSITTASEESFSIRVYNNLGVKIHEETKVDVNGSLNKMIDLRPVPDGIYTVIFENNMNQIVKKIVVNK